MKPTPPPHDAISALVPSSVEYDTLRVTAQAKMTNLIAFALEKLQLPETSPMLFHSFPSQSPTTSTAALFPLEAATTSTPLALNNPPPAPDPTAVTPHIHEANPVVNTPSTSSALPKLISIVEIIKRTYVPPPRPVKEAEEDVEIAVGAATTRRRKKGKGKSVAIGLHQYTRLGSLESIGVAGEEIVEDPEEEEEETERKRQEKIALNWVESGAGRSKRPRRKHSPYMLVVLFRSRIQALDNDSAWSYQAPNRPPSAAAPTKALEATAETGVEVDTAVANPPAKQDVAGDTTKKTKHSRKRTRPRSKLLAGKTAPTDAMDTSTTSLIAGTSV